MESGLISKGNGRKVLYVHLENIFPLKYWLSFMCCRSTKYSKTLIEQPVIWLNRLKMFKIN